MKSVVSSDWHLDRVTMGVSRFDEIATAIDDTMSLAEEEEVDAYFFLGDLSDPNCGSVAYRITHYLLKMALRLKRAGIEFHALMGNHDPIEDGSGRSTLTPLRALAEEYDGIFVHEEPWKHVWMKHGNPVNMIFLPHSPISRPYDPEDFVKRVWDPKRLNVVAAHLTIPGILPGEESNELARGRDTIFPLEATKDAALRLNGHYHQTQVFDGIHIPGSLARLTASEEKHKPAYFLLEV